MDFIAIDSYRIAGKLAAPGIDPFARASIEDPLMRTADPREMLVQAYDDGDENLVIEIRDSGVGFAPDMADRIFDAFYTTKPAGMGMGLSISRSIVESQGGRLWARVNDDFGATFIFSMPIVRAS